MAMGPIKLFYCYAREDQTLRKELGNHLALLRRQGHIREWYDGEILPGNSWEPEIKHQLNRSHIILLLVSPDFIASDFCYCTEMKQAIERHQRGVARVIPVLLRSADCTDAPFSSLQMLPSNALPVTGAPDRDEAFKDVAEGIRRVVMDLLDGPEFKRTLPHSFISRRKLVVGGVVALGAGVFSASRLWPSGSPVPTPTPVRTGKPTGDVASFAVFPDYDPSGYVGDVNDITTARKQNVVHFTYISTGRGRHEWEYKYLDDGTLNPIPCQFAGVLYLDPPNNFGTDPQGGYDLRGRHIIKWQARSLNGPAYVDFVAGGAVWMWDEQTHARVGVPYPDSLPRIPLGTQELTGTWQTFQYDLSALSPDELRDVVAGFGLVIAWGSNGVQVNEAGTEAQQPETFIIEIQGIAYERE
ncbi:MAG TPA: toll/interleukin-1 receptor domain-containing protein [Ktedonobacteraceae bacterium]|jgi:hypothetical protein